MNKTLVNEIKEIYISQNDIIKERLTLFSNTFINGNDKEIFAELSFCLLTPQSKAKLCWASIEKLVETQTLYTGSEYKVKSLLYGVRFPNNKSKYIVEARNFFTINNQIQIKDKILSFNSNFERRNWLVKNIKGMGYKEAGHFLRNIGFGDGLAILDRHILKNMINLEIISEIPKSLTPVKYMEIEKKFWSFAEEINVSGLFLDMILWYKEAGSFFK